MKIAVGCDHAGFLLKKTVLDEIEKLGHSTLDFGTDSAKEAVDYPDFAYKVGKAVRDDQADRGVVICGSGVGACITVNKIDGIYAGVCHDSYSAHQGVEHDGMNVLCIGSRIIGEEIAKEVVISFLEAEIEEVERHQKRRKKVRAIESKTYEKIYG